MNLSEDALYKTKLVEQLRKDYIIPGEWNAYLANGFVWNALEDNYKVSDKYESIDLNDRWLKSEGFVGAIIEKDFTLIKCEGYECMFVWLFCESDEVFWEKYIKNIPVQEKRAKVDPGVYYPRRGQMGWGFEPIDLRNVTIPTLNDNLLEQIDKEIRAFQIKKNIYDEIGVDYKRGILLYGPPGNGKTSFIKHLLKDKKAISVLVNAQNDDMIGFIGDFIQMRHLEKTLRIIVIEDIDGMSEYMRSAILNFIDGVKSYSNIIFIATSNFPEKVDMALTNRPSRFDSIYGIGTPNKKSRRILIKSFFKDITDEDLEEAIRLTSGLSGAYFKELYVFARLNELTVIEAAKELKRRFDLIGKGWDSYLG